MWPYCVHRIRVLSFVSLIWFLSAVLFICCTHSGPLFAMVLRSERSQMSHRTAQQQLSSVTAPALGRPRPRPGWAGKCDGGEVFPDVQLERHAHADR